jgi:hypothetical protein
MNGFYFNLNHSCNEKSRVHSRHVPLPGGLRCNKLIVLYILIQLNKTQFNYLETKLTTYYRYATVSLSFRGSMMSAVPKLAQPI